MLITFWTLLNYFTLLIRLIDLVRDFDYLTYLIYSFYIFYLNLFDKIKARKEIFIIWLNENLKKKEHLKLFTVILYFYFFISNKLINEIY